MPYTIVYPVPCFSGHISAWCASHRPPWLHPMDYPTVCAKGYAMDCISQGVSRAPSHGVSLSNYRDGAHAPMVYPS